MKRSANYETNDSVISVRPNMVEVEEEVEPQLGYITIFTRTSKIHINRQYIAEVKDILQAIENRYINKSE